MQRNRAVSEVKKTENAPHTSLCFSDECLPGLSPNPQIPFNIYLKQHLQIIIYYF